MDKNKSAYKLKNIGRYMHLILMVNQKKKEYMEEQFKYWDIENYERVSGYDGRDDDLGDMKCIRADDIEGEGWLHYLTFKGN